MFAAITWDLAGITEPLVSLGAALLTGAGLVIAGGIVVYGLIRAVRVMKKVFGGVAS
jgi:hypothetical protein